MKYALDRMLPLNAFQGRGTPVGGRSLRLWGYDDYGNWIATGDEVSDPRLGAVVPDGQGGWTAAAAAPAPAPEPAAAPAPEPAPAPAPEPAPAPLAAAPAATDWTQTVNDIYQQTFGRQADPSGMASFTAALNAGMTGEQMRATLASSPEGQSMGLSPAPAPVAPLTAIAATAAPTDGTYDPNLYANTYYDNPDVITAAAQAKQAVTPESVAATYQQLFNAPAPPDFVASVVNNYAGSSIDNVARDMATSAATSSVPFANTPGDPNSFTTGAQYYESQGYVPGSTNYEGVPTSFIDPTTGQTVASYGTIAPVGGASTAVQSGNWTWNDASQIPTGFTTDLAQAKTDTHNFQDFLKAGALVAAVAATAGALAPEAIGAGALESATAGELGFAGGSGAIGAGDAGAALTAGGDALTAGTLSDTAASSLMNADLLPAEMQIPASGVNLSAAATAAAKSAAINAAVTAAQGGSPTDILKAGALGAVAGGAGAAGADLLGGGTLAQIGAQTAVATATAAATGKDPVQAALSGALTATVSNIIPSSTSDILNGAGITDPSVQKAVNSAISSSIITAIKGGDVSTAALMGAVNSGLGSVAGMIGNSQVVQDIKASINDTISSTVDSIKYETGITNAQALPVEGSNKAIAGTPLDTATQPDVVNSVFQQDAQDAMNRNVPPPLVQNAIDQNTPKTVDNVVTPPLIQQAVNQSDSERMAQALLGFQQNPTVGAPLAPTASAATSDVNPVPVPSNDGLTVNISGTGDEALAKYNQVLVAHGYAPVTIDDPEYRQWAAQYLENQANISDSGTSNQSTINDLYAIAGPKLAQEAYDPAVAALQKEGIPVTFQSIEKYAQDPAALAEAAYKGFYGRAPTVQEADTIAYQINEMGVSPNDIIKDLYDQSKQVAWLEQPPLTAAPTTAPTPTPQPPLTPAAPVTTPTASASSSSSGDTKPAGGLGTQGGAAAGNEGAPGAVSPAGAASFAEAQNIVSQAASAEELSADDIIIATQRLVFNSTTLGASPAQAVASGLVTPDGSLTAKGVKQISDATGLSPSDVIALTNASTTARTGTGSGITSTGAGATTGAATGAALAGTGIGGSTGTNIGGLGTGTGTGVGPGAGTGTGEGSGDGLGIGLGGGSGTGTSGAGTGGVKATTAAPVVQPSYSYSGAGTQGETVGALPGNLQATFLQGVNVNEYNPFENYDKYQQLAPVHAAQGGSPLQLAQMQQGIAGVDPSLYNVLQKRQAPSYFTYGQDTSGGNPTTFAGSQLLGKPTPGIPVIPTGQKSGSDWLYQGSGTNPLAMAGTGIASLGAGTMAQGGQAHDGGEGEHIPEFITGATGHYVKGRGDGQSDDIPAMLADGEFVFDSSSVSTLGNGSSDAGAKLLDAFRESLREHTRSAPKDKIPPKASPLMYMQEAMKKVGMK